MHSSVFLKTNSFLFYYCYFYSFFNFCFIPFRMGVNVETFLKYVLVIIFIFFSSNFNLLGKKKNFWSHNLGLCIFSFLLHVFLVFFCIFYELKSLDWLYSFHFLKKYFRFFVILVWYSIDLDSSDYFDTTNLQGVDNFTVKALKLYLNWGCIFLF